MRATRRPEIISEIMVPRPPGASTSPAFQASHASIFCAYNATSSTLELKPRATSAMHMVPTAKFRSLNTLRSRIGSSGQQLADDERDDRADGRA